MNTSVEYTCRLMELVCYFSTVMIHNLWTITYNWKITVKNQGCDDDSEEDDYDGDDSDDEAEEDMDEALAEGF